MVETQEAVIRITPLAAEKAKEILARYGKEHAAIRVYIKSGGCSGFPLGFDLAKEISSEDKIFESNGVKVVVDETSLELVKGAELDYVDNLVGSFFKLSNPNASSSCGCCCSGS